MKKLGQHFLKDPKIAEKMVEYADVSKKDIVLEIGPGKGIITQVLSERANKVIGIEKDRELAKKLNFPNLELIIGDALKTEFPKFNKIVSNLPFQISAPITFKFFEYEWDVAVLIYQKEFSERFLAKPGDKNYSRLTLAVNYYVNPEILKQISRGKISPIPEVKCNIVRFFPKKEPFKADKNFWELVKKLFQHKRKLVRAALKDAKYDRERIRQLPQKLLEKRVFRCDLYDFKEIAEKI